MQSLLSIGCVCRYTVTKTCHIIHQFIWMQSLQSQILSLYINNMRNQLNQLWLLRSPSQQLPGPNSMSPRGTTPSIQTKLVQLGYLSIRNRLHIRRRNQPFLVRNLGNLPLDITPNERSVLSKVVTPVIPGRRRTTSSRSFTQREINLAQILNMNLVPDIRALPNKQTLLPLQHSISEPVRLHTLLVTGSTAGTVDRRRADDGRLDAFGVVLASFDDDLVDVAVEGVVREVEEFGDAVPVVVLFGALDTPGVGAEVLDG
jgi:hypothetical protein